VTRLFGQLPSPSKRGEDEKKPLERRSILALAPAAPTSVTEDADAVMEVGGYEGLSPGKKTRKGAFLLCVSVFLLCSLSFPPLSVFFPNDPCRIAIDGKCSV
jgi:hypothetical protein